MSWRYTVYGLRLEANRAIPGLRPDSGGEAPDARLVLGEIPPELADPGLAQQPWYTSPHRGKQGRPVLHAWRLTERPAYRLDYYDGTQFVLERSGRRLWAAWPAAVTFEDVCTYLVGPVLSFLLRLRGVLSLHASAVVLDGRALALVGPPQAGKSTTAMGLAQRGQAVLSEDVVALAETPSGFFAQPGYNHVRLWPPSVAALFGSPDELPQLAPPWNKRFLDLEDRGYPVQTAPVPLGAIYFLGPRTTALDTPLIQPLGAREALMALVANTSANYLLDQEQRAEEFVVLSRLASRVALRRVAPHAELARLDRLCEAIVADFRECLTRTDR